MKLKVPSCKPGSKLCATWPFLEMTVLITMKHPPMSISFFFFFVSSFLVGVSNLAAKWQVSMRSSSWIAVSPSHLLLSPVYSDLSHFFLGIQLKKPAQSEREKNLMEERYFLASLMQTLPILTVFICKYQEIAIWTHPTMAGHGCPQRNWESI